MSTISISELVANSDSIRNPAGRARGLETGKGLKYATIALNGVWGGVSKSGGSVSSYEKIGYHAGTIDFLLGLFDSGCPIFVYVKRGGKLQKLRVVS